MSTINIDKREVSKVNRNGRINSSTSASTTSVTSTGASGAVIDWAEVTPELVTINRDLAITGTVTATEDVIAYFATETTSTVLDALSVSLPLLKTGTNIELKYNPLQFDIANNILNYIGTGGGASDWASITGKPTFSAVATSGSYTDLINLPTITSTIAGATDNTSYFTGTKALTASVADSANSVTWTNISSKPTTFTPAAHNQDWTTITGKPSTFTPSTHYHTLAGLTDVNSYFTGTKAYTAQTADNASSLGSIAAANYYHSGNFNKSTVPVSASTVTAATSIVVNGWTITVTSGALYFNNGSNRCKVDASGNLTCTGEITAFGSI